MSSQEVERISSSQFALSKDEMSVLHELADQGLASLAQRPKHQQFLEHLLIKLILHGAGLDRDQAFIPRPVYVTITPARGTL